ncbi:tetraspanin-15 [Vibrio phage VAP7]|uniref:Tetraspanin-15 n=1 Tax=Vibrio phage VAP7 TaxID=2584487 RepID=A0A4Y5TVF7_9CAUD|nr:tetraspanin-15 [Vibrio phage VAP7]QDB73363.1 tetraspanin-15 [Vibrio phage VAP7]UFD98145.1 hypothetical protein [Vibrio phage BX-1]
MIKFQMKLKDGTPISVQFPQAKRPDDRVEYLAYPLNQLAIIKALIKNIPDERGMLMTTKNATPVGAVNALRNKGYTVTGDEDWQIRPGVL